MLSVLLLGLLESFCPLLFELLLLSYEFVALLFEGEVVVLQRNVVWKHVILGRLLFPPWLAECLSACR